ncbi:hypothetical protein, partial [Staphylococcus aureus]
IQTFAGGATLEAKRVGFWMRQDVNLWLYGTALGVLALWMLLWPVIAVLRWRFHRPLRMELDRTARRERWLVRAIVTVTLVFFAGWLGFFASG